MVITAAWDVTEDRNRRTSGPLEAHLPTSQLQSHVAEELLLNAMRDDGTELVPVFGTVALQFHAPLL